MSLECVHNFSGFSTTQPIHLCLMSMNQAAKQQTNLARLDEPLAAFAH